MKRLLSFIFLTSSTCMLFAQNLVVNGSFEEVDSKAKGKSGVGTATGWANATERNPELFSLESKEDIYKAPDNKFGREKAFQGINYIGIVAFSYQGKESRSYATGELAEPLEKGKQYCVKFQVSLSDIAKYSSNNLGAYFSKKQFKADGNKSSLLLEAHVLHADNKVVDTQVYWEPICGTYTAEGGEKFITLGNFYGDKETTTGKAIKAKQFTQNQIPLAYYFIDDVSVVAYNDDEGCDCGQKKFVDTPEVVYKKVTGGVSNKEILEEITSNHIQFDSLKFDLKGESLIRVEKVVDALKLKSSLKIVIVGHTANFEEDKVKKQPTLSKLSQQRAEAVAAVLLKSGISKDRFKIEAVKELKPFTYETSRAEQLKNCAVNIEIQNE